MREHMDISLLDPLLEHVVGAYSLLPDKAALEKELSIYLVESARRELGTESPDMHLVVGALRLARNELSHSPDLHALCQIIDLQLEHLPSPHSGSARGRPSAHL
jgi:hypothetical protein